MVTNSKTDSEKQKSRRVNWDSLISTAEYSIYPALNQREKYFVECVEDTIESLGAAAHEEISSRLIHGRLNDHKLFTSQKDVDDVEQALCGKQAIMLTRREGASGYCIKLSEDYPFDNFTRYRSRNDVIEFNPNMPCFSIFSQIEHDLIQFIKQSYSPISPKEVQVLKHIVYGMLDGNCLSVNPEMIVIETLQDADTLFSSCTEAHDTIQSLLKRGVLQGAYAGYEFTNEDGTKRRTMPTPHIMLETGFGKRMINHLNYFYNELTSLNLLVGKHSQYLITK